MSPFSKAFTICFTKHSFLSSWIWHGRSKFRTISRTIFFLRFNCLLRDGNSKSMGLLDSWKLSCVELLSKINARSSRFGDIFLDLRIFSDLFDTFINLFSKIKDFSGMLGERIFPFELFSIIADENSWAWENFGVELARSLKNFDFTSGLFKGVVTTSEVWEDFEVDLALYLTKFGFSSVFKRIVTAWEARKLCCSFVYSLCFCLLSHRHFLNLQPQ